MVKLNNFNILNEISNNSSTRVVSALEINTGKKVLLKISKDAVNTGKFDSAQYEFNTIQSINSPRIPKAYDFFIENKITILSLEFLEGDSLISVIKEKNTFSDTKLFLTAALEISKSLADVHANKIIHLDIKPHNIMVSPDRLSYKLVDFRLAGKYQNISLQESNSTSDAQLFGTLYYMSPEQTGRTNNKIDTRSDLYSLGSTFYQMITGETPFLTTDTMGLIHSILAKRAPKLTKKTQIPEAISLIVEKLLEKAPEDRYQSIHGLIIDLESCLKLLKTKGNLNGFVPGGQDFSDHLEIPEKLYGRGKEVKTLLDAFDKSCRGSLETTLLCGFSGIGKTALVSEVLKPITRERGLFIKGKFELLKKDSPYHAIIQTFDDWVNQILQQTTEEIELWRSRLEKGLEGKLSWALSLAPALELIVGKHAPAPSLTPAETLAALASTIKNLLKVLASSDHPLTMFIDDWQWADSGSIAVLKSVLTGEGIKYLFFIGAFRSNEVTASHPFAVMLEEVEKEGRKYSKNRIELKPLTTSSVTEMLRDAFRGKFDGDEEALTSLAELIHKKTNGNPFFIRQLLSDLGARQVIKFNHLKGWGWDLQTIESLNISNNVAEFLAERFKLLSEETHEALKKAAIIGSTFDIEKISHISSQSPQEILKAIKQAVDSGFVEAKGSSFSFCHDRLKEASYALWNEQESLQAHLQLGKKLLEIGLEKAGGNIDQIDSQIAVEAVLHIGKSVSLVKSENTSLQVQFVKLSLITASRAKNRYVYSSADHFLSLCKNTLDVIQDKNLITEYQLLTLEMSAYQARYVEFDELFLAFLSTSPSLLHRGTAHKLKVRVMAARILYKEAFEHAADAARDYGLNFPKEANNLKILTRIIGANFSLSDSNLEKIPNSPLMTNQEIKMGLDILSQAFVSLYFVNPNLLALWAFQVVDICLTNGVTKEFHYALSICAILIGPTLKNFKWAAKIARASRLLGSKVSSEDLRAKTETILCWAVDAHLQDVGKWPTLIDNALKIAVEIGDMQFVGFSLTSYFQYATYSNGPIPDIFSERFLEYEQQVKKHYISPYYAVLVMRQMFDCLIDRRIPNEIGGLIFPRSDHKKYIKELSSSGFPGLCHGADCLYFSYIDKVDEGFQSALLFQETEKKMTGNPLNNSGWFHAGLAASKAFDHKQGTEKQQALSILMKAVTNFKTWYSKANPNIYAPRLMILKGELARVKGKNPAPFYLSAIQAAKKNELFNIEGIGWKLLTDWEYKSERVDTAELYAKASIEAFKKWGAHAVVSHLMHKYSIQPDDPVTQTQSQVTVNLATSISEGKTYVNDPETIGLTAQLDLQSIVKASASLAQEVVFDRLMTKLLSVIVENAGAQECWVLNKKQDEWVFGAYSKHSDLDSTQKINNQYKGKNLVDIKEISHKVITFAIRTHKPLLFEDATKDSLFIDRDSAIKNNIKSLLCVPIESKGIIIAVLYLENKEMNAAFTQQRVNTLNMLGGQIAVSLENASLYSKMEDEIYYRTKDTRSILENVRQGIFTIGKTLRVHPNFSKYLTEIMGRDNLEGALLEDLLFKNSQLTSEEIFDANDALEASIGEPLFQYEVNSDSIPKKVIKNSPYQILELDWVPIEDTNGLVVKVMTTVRDVTQLREAELKSKQQSRELEIIGQIIKINSDTFERLISSGNEMLSNVMKLLEKALTRGDLQAQDLPTILRELHTLKGTSRSCQFTEISSTIHEAEIFYAEAQHNKSKDLLRNPTELYKRILEIRSIQTLLFEYDSLYKNRLGRRAANQNSPTKLLSKIEGFLISNQYEELRNFIQIELSDPIADVMESMLGSLPDLAHMLGKKSPKVEFVGKQIRIMKASAPKIEGILTHIFRNAMEHGIHKDKEGIIVVTGVAIPKGLKILISDNGPGLNLKRLKQRGIESGLIKEDNYDSNFDNESNDAKLSELVFTSGISTSEKISEISGRGVGLDAVRLYVESLNGKVAINFTQSKDTEGCRPFELVIELPKTIAFIENSTLPLNSSLN